MRLSEEQVMFAEMVGRILTDTYGFEHRRRIISRKAPADSSLWRQLLDVGAFGIFADEDNGGFDGSLLSAGVLMEQLGRYLVVEPVGALAMAPVRLLARLGQADRAASVIEGSERLCVVDIGPAGHMSGTKVSASLRSVEGAPEATAFLAIDTDGALWRIGAEAAGVSVQSFRMIDGRIAGDVVFDNAEAVLVAEDVRVRLGEVQQELSVAEQWFQLGSMVSATEMTIDHVRQRSQFGRPLSQFQLVQARVAEMVVACEEAKAAVRLAALGFQNAETDPDRHRAVAGGKIRLSKLCDIVASNAVQLHGGMGVSEELPIASHYRQSVAFRARHGGRQAAWKTMSLSVIDTGHYAASALLGKAA